ncbi:hypothetical protein [Hahella ganghwensis]|uniref:hypothetical protein n=1 Tax=Hahella ganghwensis TaxID=286420 RepID=UPI00036BBF0D|nr:hypothetical protein [Hahella ganghwensis]
MSQFLIVIKKENPKTTVPNITFSDPKHPQSIFSEVIGHYGIDPSQAWAVLDDTGDTSHNLFSGAGFEMTRGTMLSETELGVLLNELMNAGAGLIAWNACDYQDLKSINSMSELTEYLNQELGTGFGEVYFRYGLA